MSGYDKFKRSLPGGVAYNFIGHNAAEANLWDSFLGIMNHSTVRKVVPETSRKEKDKNMAEKFRKQGFEFFRQGKYAEALKSYNNAVRYCPVSSSMLGMVYANRSAVFFMENDVKRSLNDVDRALSFRIPNRVRELLNIRRDRCRSMLRSDGTMTSISRWFLSVFSPTASNPSFQNAAEPPQKADVHSPNNPDNKDYFKAAISDENKRLFAASESGQEYLPPVSGLISDDIRNDETDLVAASMRRNPWIPAATEALTMKFAPEKGRYYVAVRDIEPGEFVVNEKPYASVLYSQHWETHCQACMRLATAPVPCSSCASVVFCSRACRDKAIFHQYECPHMNDLAGFAVRDQGLLPLRMLTSRGLVYFRDRKSLLKKLDDRREATASALATRVADPTEYLNVYTLLPHLDARPYYAIDQAATIALFFTKCLASSGFFGNLVKVEDTAMVARLLFHNLLAFECNYFTLSQGGLDQNYAYVDVAERGMAVFCGSSIFNHSCNPNVTHYFLEDQLFCRANGVIPAGKEANISYGQYFYANNRDYRRKYLKESYYFFPCACEACEDDWPLFGDLEVYAQYKCPSCRQHLTSNNLKALADESCPGCKSQMKPFVGALMALKKQAEDAVTNVNAGKLKHISEAIKSVGSYQKVLHKMAIMPNAEYVNLQTIMGEFFVMESLMKRRGVPIDY